jgi:hypothetical protein
MAEAPPQLIAALADRYRIGTTKATPDLLILVENWFSELNPLLKSRAP